MTGSLENAILSSPVRPIAPNYSIDSFSEYSTRSVNRSAHSPICASSGPRSARAKEEDEELFRDLFSGENDSDVNDEPVERYKASRLTAPTFIPQKPVTRREPPTTGHPNPRQHLAPMKPAPPQPVLTTPFIPRLKLEELVKARPNLDNDEDNNLSQKTSRRGSDLGQLTEEDEFCSDDGPDEDCDGKAAPIKAKVLSHDREFSRLARNNQETNNYDQLDQDTLRFLEKLDLKTVLQTPRPDLLSFYPTTPIARNMTSPRLKEPWITTIQPENFGMDKPQLREVEQSAKETKSDFIFREPPKTSRVDVLASRLAYMESTYGTVPIARKTRRKTINRLANPISGHTSTLQALSPKQREKRESALTGRAPISPLSAAIAVSCRRGTTSKKVKSQLQMGSCKVPDPTAVCSKHTATKRQNSLVQKCRPNLSIKTQSTVVGLTKRKSKTTLVTPSLTARKEVLKKQLQGRSGTTKRFGDRKIGGSTFLTQRDDEEGVEQIEDFIARHRGIAQAPLTFRSGSKKYSQQTKPALSARILSTSKSHPRPPQARVGMPVARAPGVNRSADRGRQAHTSRERQPPGNLTGRKNDRQRAATYRSSTTRSERGPDPPKLFIQPIRPQAWQAPNIDRSAPSRTRRPTTPGGANPLRKLKLNPATPVLVPRAPKTPPSAASTLLMGLTPLFSGVTTGTNHRRSLKPKLTSSNTSSRATTFDIPTKQSELWRRTSTTFRKSGGDKPLTSRQTFAVRSTIHMK